MTVCHAANGKNDIPFKLDCRLQSPTWRLRQVAGTDAQTTFFHLCREFQIPQNWTGWSLEEFILAFREELTYITITTSDHEGVIELKSSNGVPYKQFYGFWGTTEVLKKALRTFISSIRLTFFKEEAKIDEVDGGIWWQTKLSLLKVLVPPELCSVNFVLSHYKLTEGERIKKEAQDWDEKAKAETVTKQKTAHFFEDMANAIKAAMPQEEDEQVNFTKNDTVEHKAPQPKMRRINCRFAHSKCSKNGKEQGTCPFSHETRGSYGDDNWQKAIEFLEKFKQRKMNESWGAKTKTSKKEIDEDDL